MQSLTKVPLKLNMGCGYHRTPNFINVDKFHTPTTDVVHDLETFHWPWETNSADVVQFLHSFEHMGQHPDTFISIMQELYRICMPDAKVFIVCPHPRHDDFINDPTHVRAITPDMLSLFNRELNNQWVKDNAANTPLALFHNVDFRVEMVNYDLDPRWLATAPQDQLARNMKAKADMVTQINVIRTQQIGLRVIK